MPCNRLAVQTATLAENIAAVLMDPTVVQMLAQAFAKITGDAEVRVTSNVGGTVYGSQRPLAEIITPQTRSVFFYARNIGVALNSSGRLTSLDGYYADYDNANTARARSILDQFAEMVKGAAPIATQNLLLRLLAEASGIAVTADAYTPTGARVVSFSL